MELFQVSPQPHSLLYTDLQSITSNPDDIVFKPHTLSESKSYIVDIKRKILSYLGLTQTHKIAFVAASARSLFEDCISQWSPQHPVFYDTGYWGRIAYKQALSYSAARHTASLIKISNKPENNCDWLHICHTETICGSLYSDLIHRYKDRFIVSDMTGSLLSAHNDHKHCDIIIASSGKEYGLPGMSLLILSNNAVNKLRSKDSEIIRFSDYVDKNPVTPSLIHIRLLGMHIDRLLSRGKIARHKEKISFAEAIYTFIDSHELLSVHTDSHRRSPDYIIFTAKNNSALKSRLSAFKNHSALQNTYRVSLQWAQDIHDIELLMHQLNAPKVQYDCNN